MIMKKQNNRQNQVKSLDFSNNPSMIRKPALGNSAAKNPTQKSPHLLKGFIMTGTQSGYANAAKAPAGGTTAQMARQMGSTAKVPHSSEPLKASPLKAEGQKPIMKASQIS